MGLVTRAPSAALGASRSSSTRSSDEAPPPRIVSAVQRAPRMGVAIFDNERDAGSGWACASDGEPYYFSSMAALSSDTVWIVNLEFNTFNERAGSTHNLRRVDWLKTAMARVASDLGVRCDGEYAREATSALAKVYQRCALIAMTLYGWDEPSSRMIEQVLADDIRKSITPAPKPQSHMKSAFLGAYQSHSSPSWPMGGYVGNTLSVTMRLNRVEYANTLLNQPVPDEGWTVLYEAGSALSRGDADVERYLDPEKPTLIEATVEIGSGDPQIAALASFGTEPGQRRVSARRWISQPELAWLHKYAVVRIQTVLGSSEMRYLPDSARLPKALMSDPLFSLSISAGLVAEAHFAAIATPARSKVPKATNTSAWSVWMRAYDRAASFDLALRALQAGFQPTSYGSGAVTVTLTKDRLPELLAFAEASGVAHPAFYPLLVEHGHVLE